MVRGDRLRRLGGVPLGDAGVSRLQGGVEHDDDGVVAAAVHGA